MNDLEKKDQEQSAPEPAESTTATTDADSSQESTKPSQKIAVIALILALAGLIMSYLKWGEINASLQQEIKTLEAIQEQRQEDKGRLEKSDLAISAQQDAVTKQNERIKMQAEEMEQSLELIYERVGGNSTQWLVAEAEYLMRIANHRLLLERDGKTALVALERADKRLLESRDPVWTPIREQLALEMAALKGLTELDMAGYAAKLSGIASQVDKLKLPHATTVESEQPEEIPKEEKEFNLDSVMQDFLRGLTSILKVRRHDQPIGAMLEPDQTFFLYQNLRLQLEGARVALLRRDQPLFDGSLQRIETWIKKFFDQEEALTKSILQGITELRTLELKADMPDITGSLRMLLEHLGRGDEIAEQAEEEPESIAEEQPQADQDQKMVEETVKPTIEEQQMGAEQKSTEEAPKPASENENQTAQGQELTTGEQNKVDAEQEPAAEKQKEGL